MRWLCIALCVACIDPVARSTKPVKCDRFAIVVADASVDVRVINKVLNTTKAAGMYVVTGDEMPRECALSAAVIQISRSEITLQGQLIATTESVLRDDSPTFKVDALFEGLQGATRQLKPPVVVNMALVQPEATTGERYHDYGRNPWVVAAVDRRSTFAADVDTASYTIARRKLEDGELPPPGSVRVEEFVNYFDYTFPAGSPFAVVMDAAPSPLAPARHVVRVGVATQRKTARQRPPAHLVFLVDVSGSMADVDRLPLAKRALKILTKNLTDADTVAIVTYAGSTEVVLEPTNDKALILAAIESLQAGGSTAMASGIDLAYERAVRSVRAGHISRVVVLSDGDANVGAHTHEEILQIIASRAKRGVTLSTIGFGMGNYNDELMEQLADKGNGNNFYVDSLDAAKRVFGDKLTANLEVVAKDVKLQVDFDPAIVWRYRLVGYENRDIADADFRNDKVDAGEVGPGHQVTALYEVELTPLGRITNKPLGAVHIRYKPPQQEIATELAFAMTAGPAASFAQAAADFRFAFAVAAFADVLRGNTEWSLATIRDLANAAADRSERKQLVGLIDNAIRIRRVAKL